MSKILLKRRAQWIGLAKRQVSEGEAVYMVFDVMHPQTVSKGKDKGVLLPVPIIVKARAFGAEDFTGPVKVTVLMEQMSQADFEKCKAEQGSRLVVVPSLDGVGGPEKKENGR